ncbi:MAG: hypothetical protein F6K37_27100, partial [Moorea sp. SIO4E2]|uniref:hypothetical protein n=1 Tax=Moorena sp. SIO4E2 TaxID=2607826 RepID=UPI0013BBDFE4
QKVVYKITEFCWEAIDLGLSATLREWSRYAMLGTSRYANAFWGTLRLTLAFRPRYANGHATRCSVRAATRTRKNRFY